MDLYFRWQVDWIFHQNFQHLFRFVLKKLVCYITRDRWVCNPYIKRNSSGGKVCRSPGYNLHFYSHSNTKFVSHLPLRRACLQAETYCVWSFPSTELSLLGLTLDQCFLKSNLSFYTLFTDFSWAASFTNAVLNFHCLASTFHLLVHWLQGSFEPRWHPTATDSFMTLSK